MNYQYLGKYTGKGCDATGGMAFFMIGHPVKRVYEDELRKAFMGGDKIAGTALDELIAWKWKFLEGNK